MSPRRPLVTVIAIAVSLNLLIASIAIGAVYQGRVRPGYAGDGDLVVILLVGSDQGPPDRPGDPAKGRADAVHLLAVDPKKAAATIVDIPRDSVVGNDKINAYLATGGPERMKQAVEELSGLKIDFWVLTSFQGFADLVDAEGGVEVTIDAPIRDRHAKATFRKGKQKLNGREALAFSRVRKTLPDGDFGRTRHQGELLQAAQEDIAGRNLLELVKLTAAFRRHTMSNIGAEDVLSLGLLASKVEPKAVLHVPMKGSLTTVNGASAVQLEPGDAFARIKKGEVGPS